MVEIQQIIDKVIGKLIELNPELVVRASRESGAVQEIVELEAGVS
jgi:hypothetical protein